MNRVLKDALNLTQSEVEKLSIVLISFSLAALCIFTSLAILPERCHLFSDNIPGGFECDGFNPNIPIEPCGCQDRRMASVATVAAGLGVGLIFLPFFIFAIRNPRKPADNSAKIFD